MVKHQMMVMGTETMMEHQLMVVGLVKDLLHVGGALVEFGWLVGLVKELSWFLLVRHE